MNEWEFTAAAAGWINELIGKDNQLPFLTARCERSSGETRKRNDLILLDRNSSIVLTGEVKLPYNKDGGSPLNAAVVRDARAKARRAGSRFFFTWNVNEFVLWETDPADASWQGQKYRSWEVTQVHREGHLDLPMTIHAVRVWLDDFLHEFARIVHGDAVIGHKSPDEKFIEALFRQMAWRQAGKEAELEKLSDLCELDMADRRELDDAVLEMLGVSSAKRRREMIDDLYRYLREFFERTRQKEEKAILNKNKARRRGKTDPAELATQIYQELAKDHGEFLWQYDPDFLDKMRPFDTYEIPPEGVPVPYRDMFVPHSVRFIKGKKTQTALLRTQIAVQDDLIVLICRSGLRGLVRVPHEENECRRVLGAYEGFIGKRENLLRRLIEERSADEDLQRMIYDALLPLVLSGRREEKKRVFPKDETE